MKPATAPSALRVQAVLGEKYEVLEFDAGTRTAADAAAAIGCTVAEIAKSLVFRGALPGARPWWWRRARTAWTSGRWRR